MDELNFHEFSVLETLYAQAIGKNVLWYMQNHDFSRLPQLVECEAINLIEEIRQILNDPDLEDSTCFLRIDAIVSAFLRSGVPVDRHDF